MQQKKWPKNLKKQAQKSKLNNYTYSIKLKKIKNGYGLPYPFFVAENKNYFAFDFLKLSSPCLTNNIVTKDNPAKIAP